jgi:hypothetical protein
MGILSLHYAYLLATLLTLGPFFLLFWWLRPDIHRKMLRLALLGSIAGPISEYWYVQDYWHPEHISYVSGFFEDLIFAGLLVGVTAGLYSVCAHARSVDAGYGDRRSRYVIALCVNMGAFVLFTNLLHLNSIYASVIGFFLLTMIIWYQRSDLMIPSLIGGTIWLIATLVGYSVVLLFWPTLINEWWQWGNISGITLFHIPLEEFMWFTTWGMVGSVIYEWKHGQKFVPLNKQKIAR